MNDKWEAWPLNWFLDEDGKGRFHPLKWVVDKKYRNFEEAGDEGMNDGIIIMDSEDAKSFGFLSVIFNDSWLWKKGKSIYLSMIIVREEKRNQGYTRKLIEKILDAGYTVKIPCPMGWMQFIVRNMKFVRKDENDPRMGMCEVWVKSPVKEEKQEMKE